MIEGRTYVTTSDRGAGARGAIASRGGPASGRIEDDPTRGLLRSSTCHPGLPGVSCVPRRSGIANPCVAFVHFPTRIVRALVVDSGRTGAEARGGRPGLRGRTAPWRGPDPKPLSWFSHQGFFIPVA